MLRYATSASAATALVLVCVALATAAAIESGLWTIGVEDGRATVRLNGAPVLVGNYVTFYEPEWKGVRLTTAGVAPEMKRERTGAALTCTQSVTGVGRADMTLVAKPDALEFRAKLRSEVAGPVEIGFLIPPGSLWKDGAAVLETTGLGGRAEQHLEVGVVPFEQQSGFDTLRCEAAGHLLEISVATSRGEWVLQDLRRSNEKAVRLVMSASVGAEAAELTATATIHAREIGGDVAPLPRLVNLLDGNAGFEEGADRWQCPDNAVPDDEVALEGKRSMRMTVTARGQGVYVTRYVPVVEGRRYGAAALIRTQDVRPLPPGPGYSSTGATLIVEWADENRKWLAAGVYASGVYGTQDWRDVQIRDLSPAPPRARYAIIFLSLRAIGTAWFDDVRFHEMPQRPVKLTAPADGSTIADNRPLFRWERAPVPGYVLQLSTNNAFMAPLIEAHVQETSWRPPEPVGKGTWYWRVARGSSSAFSETASFTQKADPSADTTGPTLCLASQSLADADEPIRVAALDPSGIAPRSARAWIDGRPTRRSDVVVDDTGIAIRPRDGWERGLHWLRLRAADRKGNVTDDECPFVFGKAPARYGFRRDGVLSEDGRPVFPFGIYQIDEDDMAAAEALGFDLIHNYRFESSQDNGAAREYLDAAEEHGLKVFMGFDRGIGSSNGLMQGNLRTLCERVGALMDHPALAAWYLYDEPEIGHQYVSPSQLRTYYETIKGLDPYHPVCVVSGLSDPSDYLGAFDWFWSEEYTTARAVASLMQDRRRALPHVPMSAIVHCYDAAQTSAMREGETPDVSRFHPTPRELRANAYTAITQGSNGLLYWWYGDGGRQFLALGEVPAAQEAVKSILAELRSVEPFLVADVPVLEPDCEPPDAGLYLWAKQHEGKLLVIAVNPGDATVDVRLRLRKVGTQEASVLFEGRRVRVDGGTLADRFDGLAVHVYELATQ